MTRPHLDQRVREEREVRLRLSDEEDIRILIYGQHNEGKNVQILLATLPWGGAGQQMVPARYGSGYSLTHQRAQVDKDRPRASPRTCPAARSSK